MTTFNALQQVRNEQSNGKSFPLPSWLTKDNNCLQLAITGKVKYSSLSLSLSLRPRIITH